MSVTLHLLGPDDAATLQSVADGVFDNAVDPRLAAEFVADPRHHLVVAVEDGVVVGMASGVTYLHPDKSVQLFVNEVGVAPSHRRRGIARRLTEALFDHARALGCTEAWLGTEVDNAAARRLYESAGGTETAESFVLYEFRLGGDEA